MTIWILWAVLVTGDRIEAGQYLDESRCYASAQMQRPFWLRQTPRVRRMECKGSQT